MTVVRSTTLAAQMEALVVAVLEALEATQPQRKMVARAALESCLLIRAWLVAAVVLLVLVLLGRHPMVVALVKALRGTLLLALMVVAVAVLRARVRLVLVAAGFC
jgi:hypothetical protein